MHLPTERCTARQIPERTFRTWEIPQEYWVYSVHPISGQIHISNYWLVVCVYTHIYICMYVMYKCIYCIYSYIYIFIYRDIPGNKLLLCLLRPPWSLIFIPSATENAVDEDAALVRVLGNLMSSHPQVAWDPVVNRWFLAIKWPEILGTKRWLHYKWWL